MQQRRRRSYLLQRTFLIYAVALALFFIVVASGFITYTLERQNAIVTERYLRMSERVKEQLDALFREMDQISIYIASAPQVRQLGEAESANFSEIQNLYGVTLPFNVPTALRHQRIFLLNHKLDYYSVGKPIDWARANAAVTGEEIGRWLREPGQKSVFLPPGPDPFGKDEGYYPFSCVRPIRDTHLYRNLGLVILSLPSSYLREILSTGAEGERLFLLDAEGRAIGLTAGEGGEDYTALLRRFDEAGAEHLVDSEYAASPPALFARRTLDYTGWQLILEVPADILRGEDLSRLLTLSLLLLVFYLLLTFLGYLFLGRSVRPLADLRAQVEQVTLESPEIALDPALQPNEIEAINDALRKMVERLHRSASENALMRARELEASFYALQAQINPHFLFNVLSSLAASAKAEGNSELEQPLLQLSTMLRYVTAAQPGVVGLEEELAYLRDYLSLMKLRFEDQLHYSLRVDESVGDTRAIPLPRLALQPIVENAFSHGFKAILPPWRLWVEIFRAGDTLHIDVKDNGVGIDAAQRAALESRIEAFLSDPAKNIEGVKIGGMGLVSSLSRSRYLYRAAFSYEIRALYEPAQAGGGRGADGAAPARGCFIRLSYRLSPPGAGPGAGEDGGGERTEPQDAPEGRGERAEPESPDGRTEPEGRGEEP